jgi:hypothetical protein
LFVSPTSSPQEQSEYSEQKSRVDISGLLTGCVQQYTDFAACCANADAATPSRNQRAVGQLVDI